MKKRPVTIVDLANHLHISKSTVSRALRDRYDINPETRELVLKAAKELGYRPNTMAVNLKKNMSFTIGVIIPSFQIPFYAGAISGIQETCSK
jgi:LacI family transcriptional regulator